MKKYDFYFVLPFISISYPTGGIKIIYELARRLRDRNYNVAIQFLTDPYRVPREFFKGKKINEFETKVYVAKNLLNNKFSFKFVVPALRRILGDEFNDNFTGIDVYFSRGFPKNIVSIRYIATGYADAFFVDKCVKDGRKYFLSLHDETNLNYLNNLSWLAEEAYKLPMKLIVINEDMLQRYCEKEPLIFHVGIDISFFKDREYISKSKNNIVLLQIRAGKMKGASYGIEAAKLIHENFGDVKILAFGNYPEDEVPEFIEYYFKPNDELLRRLFHRATIFVLPSLLEGMSLPILEAMACGCAVVSSDCIGIHVYMKNGVNGVIVPPADAHELFKAVKSLIQNPALVVRLRQNGEKTALRYSYENMTDEFVNCIEKFERTITPEFRTNFFNTE